MNSPVSQAAEFPASTQSVLREPAPLPASKKVWHNPMMVPLRPVASRHRWFLGFCFFVLFFALWALVTFTGLVSPTFLACTGRLYSGVHYRRAAGYSDGLIQTDRSVF